MLVKSRNFPRAMSLIKRAGVAGISMAFCDATGLTPLHYAVKSRQSSFIKGLLNAKADVNRQDKRPLNSASRG